jgi:uncharacterized protein (TIGR02594 family)
MNRIIMLAAATLALTSVAEARPAISPECNRTMPCDLGSNNFLAGVVSIKVTMHRESITPKAYSRRHKSRVSGYLDITHSYTGGNLVSTARAYLGQTAGQIGLRRTLWCSAFIRHITHAAGVDDRAISWNGKQHVSAAVGTIAVMRHHVGIVSGFDASGNPIIISGNSGRRVREAVYPRRRIMAFVSAS